MKTTKQMALASLINESKNIVFLTGAGMSTESGIPDFRSSTGIWTQELSREQIMSLGFFNRKPKIFWPSFKDIFQIKLSDQYKPNYGHEFISQLENKDKNVTVLTQNVDGLHSDAGSTSVYEIHGSIKKAYCQKHKDIQYDIAYVNNNEIPRCSHTNSKGKVCNFILKPGVILFGDTILQYKEAVEASLQADLFIVLGTSLLVSPVNDIPSIVYHNRKAKMVIINNESTEMDDLFNVVIHDGIGKTLKEVDRILKNSLQTLDI